MKSLGTTGLNYEYTGYIESLFEFTNNLELFVQECRIRQVIVCLLWVSVGTEASNNKMYTGFYSAFQCIFFKQKQILFY